MVPSAHKRDLYPEQKGMHNVRAASSPCSVRISKIIPSRWTLTTGFMVR